MTKPLKEKVSFTLKIQLFILTLACSGLVYLGLGPWAALKSSLLYLVFLGIAEMIHWVQMRKNVQCEVCDFDPILYKEDWKKARALVEAKMQGAFQKASEQIKETIEFKADEIRLGGKVEAAQSSLQGLPPTGQDKTLPTSHVPPSTSAAKSLSSLK